jgi:hypothetical protein
MLTEKLNDRLDAIEGQICDVEKRMTDKITNKLTKVIENVLVWKHPSYRRK